MRRPTELPRDLTQYGFIVVNLWRVLAEDQYFSLDSYSV